MQVTKVHIKIPPDRILRSHKVQDIMGTFEGTVQLLWQELLSIPSMVSNFQ